MSQLNLEGKTAFTMPEATHYSGLSRDVLYRLMRAGELESVKVFGARRILKSALDELLRKHARKGI